jgi:hypothetical protein
LAAELRWYALCMEYAFGRAPKDECKGCPVAMATGAKQCKKNSLRNARRYAHSVWFHLNYRLMKEKKGDWVAQHHEATVAEANWLVSLIDDPLAHANDPQAVFRLP